MPKTDVHFKNNVIASFGRARSDMNDFKRSVTDWILFLDSTNRDLQQRVVELERQVEELKKDRLVVYQ